MTEQTWDMTIIGGGLAGLLLALKLSHPEYRKDQPFACQLLESQSACGGRLTALGLEFLPLPVKESLFRHLYGALTAAEQALWEQHAASFHEVTAAQRCCYVVKKEALPLAQVMAKKTSFLTDKESEFFKSVCDDVMPEPFLPFQQDVNLCGFLVNVLQNRSVVVRTACSLVELQKDTDQFRLFVNDQHLPQQTEFFTRRVALCLPLITSMGLMPREWYLPEQAKSLTRLPPRSCVLYEIHNFSTVSSGLVPWQPYDTAIFPGERVQAFCTTDNRLVLFAYLPFEDSLQAAAVRDALTRLKKAACRVLQEQFLPSLKAGFRMPHEGFSEKVTLLPVAHAARPEGKLSLEMSKVHTALANLYVCGDGLFSLADEPWRCVVQSVNAVVAALP